MSSLGLKRFSITKLFGVKNFDIKFNEGACIIVAENGSGKTTLLRIIYYFLSKQWIKLLDFKFDSIVADIGGKKIKFDRSQFLKRNIQDLEIARITEKYPVYQEFFEGDFKEMDLMDLIRYPFKLQHIEAEYDVPINLLIKVVDELTQELFLYQNADWNETIIYLPTFRRIEREFSDLFADMDKRLEIRLKSLLPLSFPTDFGSSEGSDALNSSNSELSKVFTELWTSRDLENWKKKVAENYSAELLEFGMSDVKYHVRTYLSQLTGQDENAPITIDENIVRFLELSNKYLTNNQLFIEGKSLTVKSKSEEFLDLNDLSSGEKQIISLFSHLCLSKSPPVLIVDEPEISLSITWQETLLQDMISAGVCFLLVATHSPFIVSDSLKGLTRGINEFLKP